MTSPDGSNLYRSEMESKRGQHGESQFTLT